MNAGDLDDWLRRAYALAVPTLSRIVSLIIQLGPLVLLAVLYARQTATLANGRHPVSAWRQACFYAGLATVAAALALLGSGSQELLVVHMAEHLLVGDIAAILIVLGLTAPLLAPVLRIGFFNRLRALSNPAIALPLWVLDLYAWHLPVLYQAALRNSGVHALEHVMFLALGINLWMCLLGPLPMPSLVRRALAGLSTCSATGWPERCSRTRSSGSRLPSTPTTLRGLELGDLAADRPEARGRDHDDRGQHRDAVRRGLAARRAGCARTRNARRSCICPLVRCFDSASSAPAGRCGPDVPPSCASGSRRKVRQRRTRPGGSPRPAYEGVRSPSTAGRPRAHSGVRRIGACASTST